SGSSSKRESNYPNDEGYRYSTERTHPYSSRAINLRICEVKNSKNKNKRAYNFSEKIYGEVANSRGCTKSGLLYSGIFCCIEMIFMNKPNQKSSAHSP